MVYSHWLGQEAGPGQGPGRASINQWKHFQDLKNGYQIHSSGPENVPSVLIKKFFPVPVPVEGPDSGPSQCEYTITEMGHGSQDRILLSLSFLQFDPVNEVAGG